MRRYEALVFSGGGVHGFAMLGALHHMQQAGMLGDANTVVGTSAGSLVAAVHALGHDPRQVLQNALRNSLLSYISLDFDGLVQNFGLDSGEGLQRLIDETLGSKVTFHQLREDTGKSLVVVATAVSSRRTVYFDADAHPDMLINTAIRMSCGVPLMFDCVRFQGELYVDGGVTAHLALDCPQVRSKMTLGVSVGCSSDPRRIDTLAQYVGALLGLLTSNSVEEDPSEARCDMLDIVVKDGNSLDVGSSRGTITSLFEHGQRVAGERFPDCSAASNTCVEGQ